MLMQSCASGELDVGAFVVLVLLGREPINPPGGRLARVRYAPIATKFCSAAKMTRWAIRRHPRSFAMTVIPFRPTID
jgi:hypothetical protein